MMAALQVQYNAPTINSLPVRGQIKVKNWMYAIVITQDEYDTLAITRV